jgi:subtilisin-like proprotein convertase family protein
MPSSNPGWLFGLGGTAADTGQRSVVDAAGNIYVVGDFSSDKVDFDPGPGTFNLSNPHGDYEGFLAKYDPSGTFLWARSIGGVGDDITWRAVLDSSGNVWAIGWLGSTIDFGGGITASGGGTWVAEFAPDTGTALWAAGFNVNATEITADTAGNVYIAGGFNGTVDFDPGPGVANLTSGTSQAVFLLSLGPSGVYRTAWRVGGFSASTLAVDSGSVYVAGSFAGSDDFDPGPGTWKLTSVKGSYDIFFARYTTGGALNWAHSVGGPSDDPSSFHRGIFALDATTLTLAEEFKGTADFDPGPGVTSLTSAGGYDVFIARYARADGSLVWVKDLGGSGDDSIQSVGRDTAGLFYLTGQFANTVDFDPGPGVVNLTATGAQGSYMLQLDANGNYVNVWQFAGAQARGFAGLVNGLAYVTGNFQGTASFPNGQSLTSAGGSDAFVLALNTQQGVIADTVFNDLNGDGVNNDGSGLLGRTVYLDLNNNGVLDTGEPAATTDRWGHYWLGQLDPGTYIVRQLLPLSSGWTQTAPTGGAYTVTVPAGQTVHLDFGNNTPNRVNTYPSGTVGLAIKDLATTTSTITISDSYSIFDLNVQLNISHSNDSDLTVVLVGPDGTGVTLLSSVGGSGGNFTNTTLDDEVASAIGSGSAPFSGSYRPQSLLSLFDNRNVQGTWTLRVTDNVRGGRGTLNSWSLLVTGPTTPGVFFRRGVAGSASSDFTGGAPTPGLSVAQQGQPDSSLVPVLLSPGLISRPTYPSPTLRALNAGGEPGLPPDQVRRAEGEEIPSRREVDRSLSASTSAHIEPHTAVDFVFGQSEGLLDVFVAALP